MGTTTSFARRPVRGELVNRDRCAAIMGVALTTLDAWVRRGCPVHRPSGRKGVPAEFDTAAVIAWARDNIAPPSRRVEGFGEASEAPPMPPGWEALDALENPIDQGYAIAQLTAGYESGRALAVLAVEEGVPIGTAFRLSHLMTIVMDRILTGKAWEFGIEPCGGGEAETEGEVFVDYPSHLSEAGFVAVNWPSLAAKAGEPDWMPPAYGGAWPELSVADRARLAEQGRRGRR